MEEYRAWLAAPASNGLVLVNFLVLAVMMWRARAAIQHQIASIYKILETALDLENLYLARRDGGQPAPPEIGKRSFFSTSDGSSSAP